MLEDFLGGSLGRGCQVVMVRIWGIEKEGKETRPP